jgi:hypothetical protein
MITDGNDSAIDEITQYVSQILDLAEPWIEKIRERRKSDLDQEPDGCPMCALITVVRGGRSSFAEKWSDCAAQALTVLREALHECPTPASADSAKSEATANGSRTVTRINVAR